MTNLAVMPKQRRLKQCMSAAFSPLTPECSSWTQASLLSAQRSVLSAKCSVLTAQRSLLSARLIGIFDLRSTKRETVTLLPVPAFSGFLTKRNNLFTNKKLRSNNCLPDDAMIV